MVCHGSKYIQMKNRMLNANKRVLFVPGRKVCFGAAEVRRSRTTGLVGHIIWNPFFLFFPKFSPKKRPGNVPRVYPKHSCFFLGTYLVRSGYVRVPDFSKIALFRDLFLFFVIFLLFQFFIFPIFGVHDCYFRACTLGGGSVCGTCASLTLVRL